MQKNEQTLRLHKGNLLLTEDECQPCIELEAAASVISCATTLCSLRNPLQQAMDGSCLPARGLCQPLCSSTCTGKPLEVSGHVIMHIYAVR